MAKSKARPTRLEGEQDLFGPGRGGRREGAGRPPMGDEPRVTKSWTVEPKVAAWIERIARRLGESQSEVVNSALRDALWRDGYDPDDDPADYPDDD